MILEIKPPSNGNFDFLKSIETFISAEDQPEARMAWKEVIPSNSDNLIELNTSSDDLQNYLKEDKFTLRVETVTDELITSDHTIDINSVFFVDAKILGI
jgi:allantoicase